jgi:hypothetical protein
MTEGSQIALKPGGEVAVEPVSEAADAAAADTAA